MQKTYLSDHGNARHGVSGGQRARAAAIPNLIRLTVPMAPGGGTDIVLE
jgi:hypothetical protein